MVGIRTIRKGKKGEGEKERRLNGIEVK